MVDVIQQTCANANFRTLIQSLEKASAKTINVSYQLGQSCKQTLEGLHQVKQIMDLDVHRIQCAKQKVEILHFVQKKLENDMDFQFEQLEARINNIKQAKEHKENNMWDLNDLNLTEAAPADLVSAPAESSAPPSPVIPVTPLFTDNFSDSSEFYRLQADPIPDADVEPQLFNFHHLQSFDSAHKCFKQSNR
jgi:hypothetical protein